MKKILSSFILTSAVVLGMLSGDVDAKSNINAETVIAGVGVPFSHCMKDDDKIDAVRKFLFEEPETKEDTEETTKTEYTEEAEEFEGFTVVAVNSHYVNIRVLPVEIGSKVVGKMYAGAVGYAEAVVDGKGGEWYYISSGSVKGYVKAEFFITGEEADRYVKEHAVLIGTVNDNANNLNVRSGPSVTTEAITLIGRGTRVVVLGEEGDFYYVQLDSSCMGYVHKDYIDLSTVGYSKKAISVSEERFEAENEYESANSTEAESTLPSENDEAASEEAARRESESASLEAERESREEEAKKQAESAAAERESVRESVEESIRQEAIQSSIAQSAAESSYIAASESIAESIRQSQEAEAAATTVTIAPTKAPETLPPETLPPETLPPETLPPETPAPTAAYAVGVNAAYIGGAKTAGQTVGAAELSVMGVFSDGSAYAVDGWSCDQVGMALLEGDNVFTVNYGEYSCSFVVNASPVPTTEAPSQTPEAPVESNLRSQLVAYSMQFVGNPYILGGYDLINGTDCSGFTMSVYAYFGYSIPHYSVAQSTVGTQIDASMIRPGDLVFYLDPNRGVIGHVALYIGNGQIIHAANETLGIIISDMYYRQPCAIVSVLP